jgi:hypothetical protein
MNFQDKTDEIQLYLNQTLRGYEVIPANFGWHIHKGDKYCGILQYQETTGWQGSALAHLPTELKEQLKKLALGSPIPQLAA